MQTLEKALLAVRAADNRRARDILVLDLEGISIIADYFVLCSGSNVRQVGAIAAQVIDELEEEGVEVVRSEGQDSARWVLLDYGDVVVHVFLESEREYYSLERLWGDARRVDLTEVIQA